LIDPDCSSSELFSDVAGGSAGAARSAGLVLSTAHAVITPRKIVAIPIPILVIGLASFLSGYMDVNNVAYNML
jgi:hypothetical protein